jgi:methionyl-tRNA formyltransferase
MIRLVFMGTGPVAARSLESLAAGNFGVELVVTKRMPEHFRGVAPVEALARRLGLEIVFANSRAELDEAILGRGLESRLGVVVDYGVILSEEVIRHFPLGIVNSHFSRLPQWRGADPISFAILSGQKSTAVSLMLVEPELDTGKIIVQRSVGIGKGETTPSLTEKLVELSNRLLAEYIPKYVEGKVRVRAQAHVERDVSYSRKLTKEDGDLDTTVLTATECERRIRAFIEWPKSRLVFRGRPTIILKAKVLEYNPGENWPDVVGCAEGTALQILEVVNPKSGKAMGVRDYLNGLRD